jgi:hypothetical protein
MIYCAIPVFNSLSAEQKSKGWNYDLCKNARICKTKIWF